MEVGTMEGRIDLEDLGDTDSLLESSPAANEETSKTEETSMMQPEDLEHEEKKQKRAVAKKPAGRPRSMSAKKPATKKRVATNRDAQASRPIGEGTKRAGGGGRGPPTRPALAPREPAPPPFF